MHSHLKLSSVLDLKHEVGLQFGIPQGFPGAKTMGLSPKAFAHCY